MQDIWQDHHRTMREIDRRYERRIRVLTITAVVLFIAFIIVLCEY